MIDPSRQYILDLYAHFEKHPHEFSRWIEESPARYRHAFTYGKLSHNHHMIAAKLIFSLFMERRSGDCVHVVNNLPQLMDDLNKCNQMAFFCEFLINDRVLHTFVIHITKKRTIYLYQSHHPIYTLHESMNKLDKLGLTSDEICVHLAPHGGAKLNRDYLSRFFKNLFHMPLDIPPFFNATFNYVKCPYRSFETFKISPVRYKIVFSPLRLMMTCMIVVAIYYAISFFREKKDYVLEIKYLIP